MANNVLTGVIQITAPGVQQTLAGVGASVSKLETQVQSFGGGVKTFSANMQGIGNVAKSATGGLGELSGSLTGLGAAIPGVAIAGFITLIGGMLLEAIKIEPMFSAIEVASGRMSYAIDQAKQSLDDLKSSLDFEGKAQKLQLELQGLAGVQLKVAGLGIDKNQGEQLIRGIDDKINQLSLSRQNYLDAINQAKNIERQIGQKDGFIGAEKAFGSLSAIPKDFLSKFDDGRKAILSSYLSLNKEITDLEADREKTRKSIAVSGLQADVDINNAAVAEQKKAQDKAKADYHKFGADMISLATKIKQVPFFGAFENNAFASFDENVKNATALVQAFYKTVGDPQKSNIKFDLPVTKIGGTLPGIDPTKTFKDPITVPVKFQLEPISREMFQQLQGIADLISGVVAPAFSELFDTIASGKDVFAAFGQFVKHIITDLIKQLIQAAIRSLIFKAIINGATGGLGSAFSNAAGALSGFAAGGPVQGGVPIIVGEKGPEIFKPNTGGSIIPNHQIMSSGSMVAGGMKVEVMGTSQVRGQDLLLVFAQANQSKLRTS